MLTTTELPLVEQKQTTPVAALAAKPQSDLDLAVVGSCRTPCQHWSTVNIGL